MIIVTVDADLWVRENREGRGRETQGFSGGKRAAPALWTVTAIDQPWMVSVDDFLALPLLTVAGYSAVLVKRQSIPSARW